MATVIDIDIGVNMEPVHQATLPQTAQSGAASRGAAPERPAVGWTPSWRSTLSSPLWLVPVWGILSALFPPTPFTTLIGLLTLAVLAVCSYTDIRWGKIRNTVTYAAVLFALVIAAFDTFLCRPPLDEFGEVVPGAVGVLGEAGLRLSAYLGSASLGASLGGAGVAFYLIMVVIYHIAGGGAGDVKLATALGALLGTTAVVDAILWTYVAAGLAIVAWLTVTLGPVSLLMWVFGKVGSKLLPALILPPTGDEYRAMQGKIRLAPFFAIGTIAVLCGVSKYLALLSGV